MGSSKQQSRPVIEQLSLDLFPPRSLAKLCEDEGYHHLTIHHHPRLSRSWHIILHRFSPQRELHIPKVFENAPEQIKKLLLQWATLPKIPGTSKGAFKSIIKRQLEAQLYAYLTQNTIPRKKTIVTHQKWQTHGAVYDLKELFDRINEKYFNNALKALLRWGTYASKTSFQTTRKESDGRVWHYIIIAGIYNHPDVPLFAIESVMYHEMLHIYIPPRIENGRRVVHGSDFHRLEKAFPHYTRWRLWEKQCVPGIVKTLRRQRR